jgi:hypothetical protein
MSVRLGAMGPKMGRFPILATSMFLTVRPKIYLNYIMLHTTGRNEAVCYLTGKLWLASSMWFILIVRAAWRVE